ncbi:hypothetical protein ThrDRAFT_01129 [Frankia casuarinae]|nr:MULTISPECIES: hypothetical protein [Frankia]ETA03381.1 hypothetical protein CcI6DRAFT_01097 [Frankia sp. CcI6]EYT93159.1 hypothetical protein ThrDRAFT_01129 [Frankia casuarinae]KDA42724.1 hypothetical protein BMG523Draft_02424 [Frankia sp. BMG5.23]KFB04158.1 hypothetical protein ALLO2DRAFT_03072 [Frankia sp. Allo2]OAA26607.1 hypothetical protein AAY23_102911 [Frankia casuarinae]
MDGGSTAARRRARRSGRTPALIVAAICGCSFVVSLVLQATLYRHGSGDADEAAYVLQARMLLDGRLTLDANTVEPFFRPWLTGEHDGRVFTKYLPGWPALLAASQALFATMAVAPALVAAGWVAGTYRLARELFDDAVTAVTAAVFVALSPLVLVHTSLPLAYACGAATLTLACAALLRGGRTGARLSLIGGGAGLGFVLLLRPFDAVIVAVPVVVFVLARLWRSAGGRSAGGRFMRAVAHRTAWALAGLAPFVVVLLAYCRRVTGSALRAPLSASDPLDRFGFGPRRILPSEPTFLFTRRLALEALHGTVVAAPSWVFGGVAVLVLAIFGALRAHRRPERVLLVVIVAAVGGGYFFWWGSAFAMPGLLNGLGPHYHLAAFAPIMILAADGARRVWSMSERWFSPWPGTGSPPARPVPRRPVLRGSGLRRPVIAVLAAAGLILLTVDAIPDKVAGQRWVNDRNAFLDALLPDRYPAPAVVVVTPGVPSRYTQVPYQMLRNTPDLAGPVVYAADIGAGTATLPDRMPGRAVYRLRPDEIVDPAAPASYFGSFTALRQVAGNRVRVQVTARDPGGAGGSGGTLYIRLGATTRTVQFGPANAGPADAPGITHTFTVTTGTPLGPDELGIAGATLPDELVVGFTVPTGAGAARWEERIPLARRPSGELALLVPGLGWRQVPNRPGAGWLPAPVRPALAVSVGAT